jgi:exopolysaccharide production protein ExoZ
VMVYASERFFRRASCPQEFFLRRLARIAPLYWATTSIILAYLLLEYGSLQAVNFSLKAVIASYLFIAYPQTDGFMAPVHGVGWTLNYEMVFYVCFCLVLPLGRRRGVVAVTSLLISLVALNRVWGLPQPLSYLAQPIILEFALGTLIALTMREGYRLPVLACIALVVSGAAGLFLSYWHNEADRLMIWGIPSALIVAGVALTEAPPKPGPLSRGIIFMGDASYSLYLVHPIAITLPRKLLGVHPSPTIASILLYITLLLCSALIAACAVHVLFDRPLTRYLQDAVTGVFPAKAPHGSTAPDSEARRTSPFPP